MLLWRLPSSAIGGLLFGAYILGANSGAYVLLMGMQLANTAGYTKRSLASSGMFVGYCLGEYGIVVSLPPMLAFDDVGRSNLL